MFPVEKVKESSGTTWSLNPQAYQNVSNEMVDWAKLAQQWIQMKENSDDVPDAPPPPPLSRSDFHKDFEEQGEAEMEVEKEEEQIQHQTTWNSSWNNFRPQQNQWQNLSSGPAGWSGWPPPSGVEVSGGAGFTRGPTEILPGTFRNPPSSISALNTVQEAPVWPRAHFPAAIVPLRGGTDLPGMVGKGDIHVSTCAPKSDVNFVQADTTQTIDAAKRKNLPAWIREGLEKMEREKLRQAEKEQEEQQHREEMEKQRQKEEEAMKELERLKKEEEDGEAKVPRKSKFESDSDSDDNDEHEQKRKKQHSNKDSGRSRSPEEQSPPVKKTVEDIMLDVRRTLTEILLEVTNEEIHEIATETLARAQKKKPKVNLSTSSILSKSNLPSKLGLAIYRNSDSEADSETDDDENTQTSEKNEDSDDRDSTDSDAELQEKVKRQVNAFKKTAREIEQQLAEEEEREERKRQEAEEREQRRKLQQACNKLAATASGLDAGSKNGGSVGERSRDGETEQLDRNSSKSGRSSRQKKQSRFSDPRDTVRGTLLTHVQILGAYKPDPLAANMIKLKPENDNQPVSERSGSSRSSGGGVAVASTSSKRSSTRSSRSRRHSDSWSDDDEASSTSSSHSSRWRRHRERSRSSDRHSRHSHSSHGSSRRSRSRSRERRSSRHSRY
ncbi:arginine/serine-rich protein PNISR [Sergentomyia squamirostris]